MNFEQTKSLERDQLEKELKSLYEADQLDRNNGLYLTDNQLYLQNEEKRALRAREIYALRQSGKAELSPQASAYLAMLFQHRDKPEDYKIAYALAKEAAEGGVQEAKWLQAAAEDRYLISIGQKQKWGTQFQKTENGWQYWGKFATDKESGITDAMRIEMGVPKRSEQKIKIVEKYPDKE